MRYLFVGDTHGAIDLGKMRSPELAGLGLGSRDAVIHCGDFGAPWCQDMDEALRFWRQLPMKVLICLGNHENYSWIRRRPQVRRFGCRGYDLGGNLFAPLAGETATLGGRRFWFYPGGFSIDFFLRKTGVDFFADELLSVDEAVRVMAGYFRRGMPEYVISHDVPRSFILQHFGFTIKQPPESYYRHTGETPGTRAHPAFMLDPVYQARRYQKWYFGHHHKDYAADSLRCLYREMVLEDSLTNEIRVIKP
ncbi:MAG: metallophosphoesterase family protein [Christensenellales bacterium]